MTRLRYASVQMGHGSCSLPRMFLFVFPLW